MSSSNNSSRFHYPPWHKKRDTSVDYNSKLQDRNLVTKEDIKYGLTQLGLGKKQVVMVHSSLSSLGYVLGGADAVIDALLEVVGPQGTVAVPTYSKNAFKFLEDDDSCYSVVEEYREPYDPDKTPVWTGLIPETLRKRKAALRSTHPTHSIAAIGPKARELTEGGWVQKLQELGGYVLLLGVSMETNSLAEAAAFYALREKRDKGFLHYKSKVMRKGKYAATLGPLPDLMRMEETYIERGVMKFGRIGQARVCLLKAEPMFEVTKETVEKDPQRIFPSLEDYSNLTVPKSVGADDTVTG